MGRLFARLTSIERMNVNIPASSDVEKQRRFIGYIQNTLVDAAETPGLLPDHVAEIRAFAEPRCGFWLPWSAHAIPLPPSRDWSIVPLVRFPSMNELRHLPFEDAFEIIVDGRPVRFSEQLACVVRCIFENYGLSVTSLVKACAPDMVPDQVIEGLLELVKNGVVCFREQTTPSDDNADSLRHMLSAPDETLQRNPRCNSKEQRSEHSGLNEAAQLHRS